MLSRIDSPWTAPRWAVIRDARRRQRRRQRRLLALVAVLLLAATVGWAIAQRAGSAQTPAPAGTSVGTVEPLALGGVVRDTTTLAGHLWVLSCLSHCSDPSSTASAGQLIELAGSGRAIRRFRVPDPTALTSGAHALWVAHFATGEVSRIDPATGRVSATTHLQLAKPIATPDYRRFEPAAISFGAGRIWASDGLGYVAAINPVTARLERVVFTSSEATSATTAAGRTWFADELKGVGTIAASGARVGVHPIAWARQPVDVTAVAHGAGLVWALGQATVYLPTRAGPTVAGVLTTLDPRTGQVRHQWQVSPGEVTMVLGDGGAYVGDDSQGRLLLLTPPRGEETLHGPAAVTLTAVTRHVLWAINRDGRLLRLSLTRR